MFVAAQGGVGPEGALIVALDLMCTSRRVRQAMAWRIHRQVCDAERARSIARPTVLGRSDNGTHVNAFG